MRYLNGILIRVQTLRCIRNNTVQKLVINTSNHNLLSVPSRLSAVSCFCYSDDKKQFIEIKKKTGAIKDVLDHKREQFKHRQHEIRIKGEELFRDIKHQKEVTGQKFRETKQHIVKDILETKAKVKERIEDVIEKENIYTIPNVLCCMRIVMSPYLGYVITQGDYNLALGIWCFAGITDLLDGWIARTWRSQSTKIGSFLDPAADKVLIATLFVSLTWQHLIPLPLTLLIIGRDVLLVGSALVIRYRSLQKPRTLSRYLDLSQTNVQLAPTFISKVNTAVQLLVVGTTLASPVFGYVDHPALHALFTFTAVSTVVSALSYLYAKNTYKYIKKKS